MSETVRKSWDDVFDMSVLEFLNLICYALDKANEKKRMINEWKKKN